MQIALITRNWNDRYLVRILVLLNFTHTISDQDTIIWNLQPFAEYWTLVKVKICSSRLYIRPHRKYETYLRGLIIEKCHKLNLLSPLAQYISHTHTHIPLEAALRFFVHFAKIIWMLLSIAHHKYSGELPIALCNISWLMCTLNQRASIAFAFNMH